MLKEEYVSHLIDGYSQEERIVIMELWNKTPWSMMDILNTYFYAKDVNKIHVVLDIASQLGIEPMDICRVFRPKLGE